MTQVETYPVPEHIADSAWIDEPTYNKMYQQSIDDPEGFWAEHGKRIHWFKPFTKVKDVHFGTDDVRIRWFYDGTTNAAYNCIDQHLPHKKDETAIIWEPDDPRDPNARHISFGEMHEEVSRFANVLKNLGVRRATG